LKKKLLIFGSGGHALSCADVINTSKKFILKGVIAENKNSKNNLNVPIVANNSNYIKLKKRISNLVIGIGFIKDNKKRTAIFNHAKKNGFNFPTIIASTAYVSTNTQILEGCIIMHNCTINAEVKVGHNCIINTSSTLEHNVSVGNNCHIAPGSIILGNAKIGNNCFIGAGAVIKNGIKIGHNCFIQANSFVNKDLKNGELIK
jgi:sugar O-acyltransferase (sialic acid O-acetyltransferase NeuD family)